MKKQFARSSYPPAQSGKRLPRALNGQPQEQLRWPVQNGQIVKPKMIGVMVFQQMAVADLIGSVETFSRARISTDNGWASRCYDVVTVGAGTEPCVMECGVVIKPHLDLEEVQPLDTLIVPGGNGIHNARLTKKIAKWLSRRASAIRRIATLGDGIYALAPTGLLDRREVATHSRFARHLAIQFPRLRVNPDCLFVKDGPYYTSAGAMAAIDLSLSLIEEDYGPRIALEVARELVVYAKRLGCQEQYSDTLQFQMKSLSRLSELTTWIVSHLNEDLSVEALAARACLCPRHFCRRFKIEFGATPADFVDRLRLEEACRRLSILDNSIDEIGTSVGFQSGDAFRRSFRRRLGVTPNQYRRRIAVGLKCTGRPVRHWQKSNGLSKAA